MAHSLVFLAGRRTPFGSFGGTLRDIHPTELGVHSAKAALAASGLDAKDIDHVIIGNILHSAADSAYMPRHIGLKLGIPQSVPALGINRLCGSGFQVIVEAFHQIFAGDTRAALVGGVENMSMSPFALRNARWGMKMGHTQTSDTMMEALTDSYVGLPMAITAENLAVQYSLSREMSDAFALRSQKLVAEAAKAGRFKTEIAPFQIQDKKGKVSELANDEHAKPDTTPETLAKLKTVFKKDGVVTAGNASGIVDGAASMIVSSESFAKERKLTPIGRLVSYGIVGCDPKIMGIGPAPAIRIALERAKMKLQDIELFEVNEAFAPQALAVQKELEIPLELLNVDGGAIALGHPLAASGTRITTHLLYELKRRGKRFGIGSACIGGGQGIALLVEAF